MSPRSDEYLAEADQRLRGARRALGDETLGVAVSSAYYAMLYAARAALSERDRFARTHRGVWQLFREAFVLSGELDAEVGALGARNQGRREGADYGAVALGPDEAAQVVADGERFVAAVRALLA